MGHETASDQGNGEAETSTSLSVPPVHNLRPGETRAPFTFGGYDSYERP